MDNNSVIEQPDQQQAAPSPEAVKVLSVLHHLTQEAILSKSRKELLFSILNNTVALTPYDRAVFVNFEQTRPFVEGISGLDVVNRDSEPVMAWNAIIPLLSSPENARVIDPQELPDKIRPSWGSAVGKSGSSVCWIPIIATHCPPDIPTHPENEEKGKLRKAEIRAGLWLERWEDKWNDNEIRLLQMLVRTYGGALDKFPQTVPLKKRIRTSLKNRKLSLVILAILLAAAMLPVRLRVTAPCEVIPSDPFVVTAPLNGVIEEIVVEPGQDVNTGELLCLYDKRVAEEEVNIAMQTVRIIEAGVLRSEMQAIGGDQKARSEIELLKLRLAQERNRLTLAQHRASQLEIQAETDGRVVIKDPFQWRGRPVVTGEQIMMIVDPDQTRLRIWIHEDDNIDFNRDVPVKVHLNAVPKSQKANISFIAGVVSQSPDGAASILAEANWQTGEAPLRMGLKGVAVLHGDRVPLAYWLLRKPLAAIRTMLGI